MNSAARRAESRHFGLEPSIDRTDVAVASLPVRQSRRNAASSDGAAHSPPGSARKASR